MTTETMQVATRNKTTINKEDKMEFKDLVYGKKYQKNGEEKTQWINVGSLAIFDDGGMSVTIDVVPLNWDGRAKVFDKKPREQQQAPQQRPQQREPEYKPQYREPQREQQRPPADDDRYQDELPF